jgi:primosomal replication protein N
MNTASIEGCIVGRDNLRYTPAGIAIIRMTLAHESTQVEASEPRTLKLELACVAVEAEARLIAQAALGTKIRVTGFLAAKSRTSRGIELHATSVEFLSDAAH